MERLKAWLRGTSIAFAPQLRKPLATTLIAAAAALASGSAKADQHAPVQASCHFQSAGDKIKRVVFLTFDNVHLRRDNPNVPSDLEQMPHLLSFLQDNGTVSGNHFTPLISHTAQDIVSVLTGLYGDRFGWTVANSYGFFRADGSVGFQTSFLYWTGLSADGQPQMINEKGKTAPAPWVPFTRAGCDVGGFSTANIEFESIPADVNTVFGKTSPEGIEANSTDKATQAKAVADFEGIAIHCAQNSPLCTGSANAKPDLLPDEPGGYTGFNALFGNKYVQPAINKNGPVLDIDGNVSPTTAPRRTPVSPASIQRPPNRSVMSRRCWKPAFPSSTSTSPTFMTTSSASHSAPKAPSVRAKPATSSSSRSTTRRSRSSSIASRRTASPRKTRCSSSPPTKTIISWAARRLRPDCDGVHVPCTYAHVGEIDTSVDRLLLTQRNNTTPFSVHSDDAPTFYLPGNPNPTDTVVRTMEHDVAALTLPNPITGNDDKLSEVLADRAEMKLLHMVPSVANRVPTFTMFANDNYFISVASNAAGHGKDCSQPPACTSEGPGFAWNHGDFQKDITQTWFGLVGPGVAKQGRFDRHLLRPHRPASDRHGRSRPEDFYVHDGRVLVENLEAHALPDFLRDSSFAYTALAQAYKEINATKGPLGVNSLFAANQAITSDDATYGKFLTKIGTITDERNELAGQMIALLNGAAFNNKPVRFDATTLELIVKAQLLNAKVQALAGN